MTAAGDGDHGDTATVGDRGILAPALIEALKRAGTVRKLPRGTVLVEAGSRADAFYIVLHGRFQVFVDGRPIAEISAGEPIGEIAFFAGGTRTATVVAARSSEVAEISREDYEDLASAVPDLPGAIIAALAGRVRAAVPATRTLAPRRGQVVGLLPAAGGTLDAAFTADLTDRLAAAGIQHLRPEDLAPGQGVADWIIARDGQADRIVLSCADPAGDPDWARQVVETTDTLLLVLDPARVPGDPARPSALEQEIGGKFLTQNVHLAILRPASQTAITGTEALLADRTVGLHHHLRAGDADDIARLARFLSGDALGVVFGGGGAFGTAHLGLLKALTEHGFTFDMVAGASIGTAMGAAYAMGYSAEEVLARVDDVFLRSRAMKRFTVPYYSVIDHKHFDAQLKRQFEGRRIEDLPINYFAVATSLTRNDLVVLRRGELWRAVRASSSIPAVFPPLVAEDGEVFIDGAFIDNVPVETMRSLKPGLNLVLSLHSKTDWRIDTDYDTLPGRAGALKRLLLGPLGRRVRFPGIFSIMTRSMIVNSERRLADTDHGADIFLPIHPPKGMGFLEWGRGRELFDLTYRRTAQALEEGSRDLSGPELLRHAARSLMGAAE